jgi:hypothetical protein
MELSGRHVLHMSLGAAMGAIHPHLPKLDSTLQLQPVCSNGRVRTCSTEHMTFSTSSISFLFSAKEMMRRDWGLDEAFSRVRVEIFSRV